MNIICPECAATGTISEALVPDGGKTVACPKCRAKFMVKKVASKVGPVAVSSPLPPEEKVPVTCRACGASGSLPASRIPPGGVTITCPKCKARFPVKRPVPLRHNAHYSSRGRDGLLPLSPVRAGGERLRTPRPGGGDRDELPRM